MNSLDLLKAYFKNETFTFDGDIKEEIKNQNEQSLAPFLYYVYGDKFLKVYLGATLIQEKFFKLQDKITKLFNENNIDHIFIKGSVIAKDYPDTALRTRGDIDVLVRECDYEKANKILEEANFKYFDKCAHHVEYYYNDLMVELHRVLYSDDDDNHEYYKDAFDKAILVKDNLYTLEHNYHYIFCTSHYNKHLTTGEGIRYLLDFYYMAKNHNLDFSYIKVDLKKLKLDKLHISIVNCIYELTGEWIDEVERIDCSKLFEFMLKSGIHSHGEESNFNANKVLSYGGSKFKRLIYASLVLDKNQRKQLYPKMSKCFLCYPIIVIHRNCYLLKHKYHVMIDTIKADKKELKALNELYEEYGIVKVRGNNH